MEPFTVIIADSLTNDFMNMSPPFDQVAVNLGREEIIRLMGQDGLSGILPTFLKTALAARRQGQRVGVILVRDLHDPDNPVQQPELLRYGPHNLQDTEGAAFVAAISPMVAEADALNTTTLGIPLEGLRRTLSRLLGTDPLGLTVEERDQVRFVLAGCHTDKRILGTAHLLRNVLEFSQVSVCPHLVGSSNPEAHFAALQSTLPDALVRVVPDLADLAAWAGLDSGSFERLPCHGCRIAPAELSNQLHPDRRAILEVALLRWSEAELAPLTGGFSGSDLFLAQGIQDGTAVTPVVIKMDSHSQMRRELEGYHRIKDRMGPAVPLFAPPISFGYSTGVVMELATREGKPTTFQNMFAKARGEKDLGVFLGKLERAIAILAERLYRPTLKTQRFNVCHTLGLDDPRQAIWLEENIGHILGRSDWRGTVTMEHDIPLLGLVETFTQLVTPGEEIEGQTALAHGDLNLANMITDNLDNLWFIDWTHTGHHPVELDFAKLENDIKFVISKEFSSTNLPQLLLLERFLTETAIPPPWEDLPEELLELSYDLRIQKVYRTVRVIRLGLRTLLGCTRWRRYRWALLRYTIHTLSFDARRHRGECRLPQLQHALISVTLLIQGLKEKEQV